MNKYAATGLAIAAAAGKQVLIVSSSRNIAMQALDDFERLEADIPGSRVSRVNGKERIEYISGGSIRFESHRSNLRGLSADIVFIDWDVETSFRASKDSGYLEFYDELRHVIVAVPGGEIIRA